MERKGFVVRFIGLQIVKHMRRHSEDRKEEEEERGVEWDIVKILHIVFAPRNCYFYDLVCVAPSTTTRH